MAKQGGLLYQTTLKTEQLYDVHGKPLVGPVDTGKAIEGNGAFTTNELATRRAIDPFAKSDLESGSTSPRRRV